MVADIAGRSSRWNVAVRCYATLWRGYVTWLLADESKCVRSTESELLAHKSALLSHVSVVFADISKLQPYESKLLSDVSILFTYVTVVFSDVTQLQSDES